MRYAKLFCESTSIRGFSRIAKVEDTFLRNLWICFVVSTTTLLVVSSYKIVLDYLQFSVNIQTFQQLDDASPFPALTFCNHQPFSENAYKLWREKKVLSPTDFNRNMRAGALDILREAHATKNLATEDMYFSLGVAWDKISIYYQNLKTEDARKLGHQQRDLIHNCMYMHGPTMGFDDRCDDGLLMVKNYSHHTYFNCLTIEAVPEKRAILTQLGLIIWLGPPENYDVQYRQGFLFDIYQQAYGLRVVVHEPNTLPEVERDGIHIEPGKMNEINYQATRFEKVNTMKNPCVEHPTTTFPDLENNFAYAPELCLRDAVQRRIVRECGCLYGYYPRLVTPNDTVPYCAKFMSNSTLLLKRAGCVRSILRDEARIKANLEESACLKKCTEIGYESTVSVTKWRPTAWQLHWLPESYKRYYLLQKAEQDPQSNDAQRRQDLYVNMSNYFSQTNLSNYPGSRDSAGFVFDDSYTFVIVKRKGNSTQIREERLVLTINALFSRIGGLCSLFIGLTLALVVELIEFFYLVCFKRRRPNPTDTTTITYPAAPPPVATVASLNTSNVNRPEEQDDENVRHRLLPGKENPVTWEGPDVLAMNDQQKMSPYSPVVVPITSVM